MKKKITSLAKKINYSIFLLSFIFFFNTNAQVSLTNTSNSVTIDFSSATPTNVGTNPGSAFSSSGFSPNPATAGRLNSNAWAVTGWTDGALAFGASNTAGDYARGVTPVSVGTGGFYAFTGAPQTAANPALMLQPGSGDFAPGTLTLKIVNNGTTAITAYTVSYNLFVRNDQARSSSFDFSYSTDNITYTNVASIGYTTTAALDALGWVQVGSSPSRQTAISSLSVNPGGSFFIRWNSADIGGAGSRDEIGLDDIFIKSDFVTSSVTSTVTITAQDPNATPVNWALGSTLNQFYWASISPVTANATLSSVSANMIGSYNSSDIASGGFKLYYSPDFTFIPSGDFLIGTQNSATGNGETVTWNGLSQVIAQNATGYIYATADISASAAIGNNLAGSFTSDPNIVFSPTVSYSGSNTYGATTVKTFASLPTDPTVFNLSCASEAKININMNAASSGTVLVFANTSGSFTTPTGPGSAFTGANTNYSLGTNYPAVGGNLVYSGAGANFSVTGTTANQNYSFIAYSYSGSNWSTGTAIINGTATTQPVTATVVTPSSGQLQLAWTNPNSTACYNNVIVIARQGSAVEASVSKSNFDGLVSDADFTGANTTWTLNSNTNDVYDLTANLIGTDNTNYLVYKGISNTITINGLTDGTTYFFRVFTVDGVGAAAKWSAAIDASGTPGLPGYYWNGGNISALPAAGGSGTWGTANSWRQPNANGGQSSWSDNNPAIFSGTAGLVTLDANRVANSYSFTVPSYTLQTFTTTAVNLTGSISIGNNGALVLSPNLPNGDDGTIGVNSISGSGSASLTIFANPSTSFKNAKINLAAANSTISVPTVITNTSGIGNAGYYISSQGGVINGNIINNSTLRTLIGATSGNDISVNGIISGSSGLIFGASAGAGTVFLNNTNTYTGPTFFNAGATASIVLGAINALGVNSDVTMSYSGNGGNLLLNGFNQTIGNLASGGSSGTILNNSALSSSTLSINQTTAGSFNRPFLDGNGGKRLGLTKNGSALLTLNGTGYTFSGGLTINNGELRYNPSSSPVNQASCPVNLNGGTFGTSSINASAVINFSTIALSNNSTIDLSAVNVHTLNFVASNGVAWTAAKTLTINGWQGVYNSTTGSAGTVGRIVVGTSSLGLTSSQLNQIRFFNGTENYGATLLSSGELVPRCTASITGVSSNTMVCENAALSLSVTATGLPLSSALSYSWAGPNSFTSSVQNPTVSSIPFAGAGVYTVTAYSSCASATAAVTVTVIQTPTINPISNIAVCGGQTVAVNFTTTPIGQSVLWGNSNTSIGLGANGIGNIPTFTTPVVPSTILANIVVTPFTLTCVGSSSVFNISVNGAQPTTVWTGAVSTDWFDFNNWTNCVPGALTDATIAAVSNNPQISSSIASVNNLSIAAGAVLNIASTETLNVCGNWVNDGTFNAQSGLVTFSGTAASQTISGTGNTSFNDLTLNNSSGAGLSSAVGIRGTLLLSSGTFTTNNLLTILSSASNSGRIGPVSSSADIIGSVSIQQFAQAGTTGWALMGSPITSGVTMADWNDNFAITCLSCPDGSVVAATPFTSIYSYDETIAGTYSATVKYLPITTISDAVTHTKGYWVYLGDSYPNTGGIMFDTQGSVAKSSCLTCGGPVTIPISKTTNNGPGDDGWNLISNPLPSPISFSALLNGDANVNPTLYAYNADLNSGTGSMATYVITTSVSSPAVGSGGIGDAIPMCQGFYVEATGNTNLTAGENIKVSSNQVFLRSNNSNTTLPLLRLFMFGASSSKDEIALYFANGATTNFDAAYDARKFISDPSYPSLAAVSGNDLLNISGLPSIANNPNITVPLKAITPTTGVFTFSLSQENFPYGICVELVDSLTNVTTNILTSTYTCTLYDTTSVNRFYLNFKTQPLSGLTSIQQPACANPNGGSIIAVGNTGAPWNYEWIDASTNTVIKTTMNLTVADTLPQLASGNYFVKVNSAGSCNTFTQAISINPVVFPTSQFSMNTNTVLLSQNQAINFTNSSNNGMSYTWDFGDGSPLSNSANPNHVYLNAGNYNVTLLATSSTSCTDVSAQMVVVLNGPVGLVEKELANTFVLENTDYVLYALKFDLSKEDNIELTLTDTKGNEIEKRKERGVTNNRIYINLKNYDSGLYLLKVATEGNGSRTFKLIKN